MRQFTLLTLALWMLLLGACYGSDAPGGDTRHAAPVELRDQSLEKAFLDAAFDVVTRYKKGYLEQVNSEKMPRAACHGAQDNYMGDREWQLLAIEARQDARKLAKEDGKAMGAYLRNIATNTPKSVAAQAAARGYSTSMRRLSVDVADLVLLLTLDALDMHDEAARSALQMIRRSNRESALLKASFCSKATRESAANLLVKNRWSTEILVTPRQEDLDFLAAVGNAETRDLLNKRLIRTLDYLGKTARPPNDYVADPSKLNPIGRKDWCEPYEKVIARIRLRLSLPQELQERRVSDELLFYQAGAGAPGLVALYEGYRFTAARLVANGSSISPAFLIERVQEIEGFSPQRLRDYNGFKGGLASPVLYIIAAQKVDAAIPAMLDMVRRRPDLRGKVEETLEEIGSPKAKEALKTLGGVRSQ